MICLVSKTFKNDSVGYLIAFVTVCAGHVFMSSWVTPATCQSLLSAYYHLSTAASLVLEPTVYSQTTVPLFAALRPVMQWDLWHEKHGSCIEAGGFCCQLYRVCLTDMSVVVPF